MDYKKRSQEVLWLPFTQMKVYDEEPIVIESGKGIKLRDTDGNEYYDANSSVWLNALGHHNNELNQAIIDQLDQIAHSSTLGMANIPAVTLADKLVQLMPAGLDRVFYSDSGATAMEIAMKIAFQYWLNAGITTKKRFIIMQNGYHGDTIGAMSVGDIDVYHKIYEPLLFQNFVAPYPNVYHHESHDAEKTKQDCLEKLENILRAHHDEICGLTIEPLMQGAAGMIDMPHGFLSGVRALCSKYNVLMIADEVAVGFGRTGKILACAHENVVPDILAAGKMLTGGYLPLAITMVSEAIYKAFYDDYDEMKTLFHGHSYTGNQLGCAVALKNLELYEKYRILENVKENAVYMHNELQQLYDLKVVGDVRQVGYMVGIELVRNKEKRQSFDPDLRVAWRATLAMRKLGLLTRPLGDTIAFLPPLIATKEEIKQMIATIKEGIQTVMEEMNYEE
ncbi:adenosylmethionine--8-amino-7-oxononanoate transaminase [Leuconostoc suionicum]|uniref:adenosylmethionine--8-amino-7-oxononanoate transaminase n=1 Tax=Leuconostoc suionicum TaxID=1511761 RepID=UPI00233EFA2C|nr:adenosylmethionine--8-amino-7-oxononanoate transaminase [Leuconostoc suionicum]MDC2805959.1 adenosylmethionine--8-amino-7-oxononanoate transaminase [Leuconostoc suionicum]MDC2823471.1 adenosylmethionine--8-amino-7-oxononanoate transaminase [Leuconostoc suionicum]